MSSTGLIVGLGLLGGGLLLLRLRESQATPPPTGGDTGDPCDLIPDAQLKAACKASRGLFGAFGNLLNAVQGANNVNQQYASREQKFDAENKALNGAVNVARQTGVLDNETVHWVGGTVIEYANGCQPFAGAPGWSKCAPGTHDMRPTALFEGLGGAPVTAHDNERATPAFRSVADKAAYTGDGDDYYQGWGRASHEVDWSQLMSGNAMEDPATTGPLGQSGDGAQAWVVKGKRVTCPAGQAPALWDAAGNPIADHRTGDVPCAPGGVATYAPSSPSGPAIPVGSSGGGVSTGGTTHTQLTWSGDCSSIPAGMTWVDATATVAGHWERMSAAGLAAGKAPHLPPTCSQPASSSPLRLGGLLAGLSRT